MTERMEDLIKHDGIVLAVGDGAAGSLSKGETNTGAMGGVSKGVAPVGNGLVRVRIVQASACAACKAKQMCMSAESQEKEMDVIPLEPLQVGDEVEVLVQQKLGWKAVLLAYILPFVVLVSVVFVLSRWLSEAAAGTIALCAIGVYYMVLSLFKGKLQKEFSFMARRRS